MKINIKVKGSKKNSEILFDNLPVGTVYKSSGGEIMLKGQFGSRYIITDSGGINSFLNNAGGSAFKSVKEVYGIISGITVMPIV